MKILFVLTYYRPHWTGLTQYAARLAEGLAQKGHNVSVLCVQHQKDLPREEIIGGVNVTRLPFLFRFIRSLVAPLLPFKLWQQVSQNEAVVIYLPLLEVLIVALMVKLAGKKLFLVHNGDLVLPEEGGFLNCLIEEIYYLATSISTKLSDGIIVQTEDYSKNSKLLFRFKDKWRFVLPLYESLKTTKAGIGKFKKEHSLTGKKLIGFSGRFVEEKGVDYLLKAIPDVIAKIPDAHFVFAGGYKISYEKFWQRVKPLIKQNKGHITLLGLIEDLKKLAVFYASLDVLAQPSRSDCFPSSLVEAVLSGIPVVCTNIPGARWVVKTTGMGVLVEPQDPSALAGGIIEVLKNREKYIKPEKEIKKIFDYQRTINQYEKLFFA